MEPFIGQILEHAYMSVVSSTMLSDMPANSTMVVPTMSVISSEPYTEIFGSEYTLPGLMITLPESVHVIGELPFAFQNGLHLKLTANERCGFPRNIFSKLIWLTIRAS